MLKLQHSQFSFKRIATRLVLGASIIGASASLHAADPIVFSFATVGDSRQDPIKADPTTLLPPRAAGAKLLNQDKIWLQNTKSWARILRTVQSQKANMLFVNGDLVMGYGHAKVPNAWATTPPSITQVVGSDLVRFYTQYAYWRGLVANLMETGTYVLPVAGNHETECNNAVTTNGVSCPSGNKKALVENEDAWRANMSDLIEDLNPAVSQRFQSVVGSAPLNVVGLNAASAPQADDTIGGTSQADLSYSFDINTAGGLLHFAIINTDPVGRDSHTPTTWLAADLAAAKARGAAKFFVFGHKPAFTYDYAGPTGLPPVSGQGLDVDVPARNAFWKVIAQYNAAYFCGHEHSTFVDQHADPTGTFAATPWHVLVGGGGSPWDDALVGTCPSCVEPLLAHEADRYYAWAVVRVRQSGAVSLDLYGFDDNFGPTKVVQSIANFQ